MTSPSQRLYEAYARNDLPLSATVELTYRCPLRCVHCFRHEQHADELSTGQWLDLFRQMRELQLVYLGLTGGEVFARPDLCDLIGGARAHGLRVHVKTSGSTTTDRLAALVEARPAQVDISFYSADPAVHDAVTRVPGSFARSLAAARTLQAGGLRVHAAYTPLAGYDEDVEGTPRRLHALGLQRVDLNRFKETLCSHDAAHLIPSEKTRHLLEASRPSRLLAAGERPAGSDRVCDVGTLQMLFVRPNGDVQPCYAIDAVAGNLATTPLAKVWQSPRMRFHRHLTWDDLPRCRDCADREFCSFCPGAALARTGEPTLPIPEFCRTARGRRTREEKR